ncbi:hypothetical protein ILYODFUR_038722 [Ilyodon furcidens]|uniref:Uncharacterized protein n=1 Tax=Ilyodon furcidens TaxID=33524 RepID=A0ABV0TEQ8_9TELE
MKFKTKKMVDFHHKVIIAVQFHGAPALRCSHGKSTILRDSAASDNNSNHVSKEQWHAHTIQNTLDSKWRFYIALNLLYPAQAIPNTEIKIKGGFYLLKSSFWGGEWEKKKGLKSTCVRS